MRNNIKVVELLPITLDDADITGSAVDCQNGNHESFDTALVIIQVGSVGANVTKAEVVIQESDASNFSAPTTAEGGSAVDISAGDSTFTAQIKRTKRYIRAFVNIEVDGADDDVEVGVSAVLWNYAKPFPIIA